jgi:hypothetical protein
MIRHLVRLFVVPLTLANPVAGSAQSCEAAAGVDTTGWRRVSAGAFSVLLPPDYREARVTGIDSEVRAWRARGRRAVGSDAGTYTNRLERASVVCEQGEAGGRESRF